MNYNVNFLDILINGCRSDKIEILSSLEADQVEAALTAIIDLTNDRAAEVRIAALHALRLVDTSQIGYVIKECLRDDDKKVRRAASALFHINDLAA